MDPVNDQNLPIAPVLPTPVNPAPTTPTNDTSAVGQAAVSIANQTSDQAAEQANAVSSTRRGQAPPLESATSAPEPLAEVAAVTEAAPAAEVAPQPEMSPEVSEFVERVERHELPTSQETVVADPEPNTPQVPKVTQPVVVLPLEEKDFAAAKVAKPNSSLKWLYIWCVRQIQKIGDTLKQIVVYREE